MAGLEVRAAPEVGLVEEQSRSMNRTCCELRVQGWAAQFPPTREVAPAARHLWWTLYGKDFRPDREPPSFIAIGDFDLVCQEPWAEGVCAAVFDTERALLWHKIRRHRDRSVEASLCLANQ